MKIIKTLICVPFAFIGGLILGMILLLISPFEWVSAVISDIWE